MLQRQKRLNETVLQIVDNQLSEQDPPQTKATYKRLINQGFSDQEARNLIGCVVISELNDVLKQEKPFNHKRFIKALRRLPALPWE